jgi:hypothetical protein
MLGEGKLIGRDLAVPKRVAQLRHSIRLAYHDIKLCREEDEAERIVKLRRLREGEAEVNTQAVRTRTSRG